MPEWVSARTQDGATVPLWVHRAEGAAKYVILLAPALGIPAGFYKRLCAELAINGISTVCMEQRGNGRSPYRPGDGSQFGLKDYLEQDLPAAVAYIEQTFLREPNAPELVLAGHSLGGHMTGLFAARNPDKTTRLVRLACGFPYHGDFTGRAAVFVRLLAFILPGVTRVFGYFPGNRMGFGGREYRELMLDWRVWAREGRYRIAGLNSLGESLRSFSGQVLSIAFDEDTMYSEAAANRGLSYFEKASVTQITLGEKEQGKHLGHINWARGPSGAAKAISDWLG